MVRRPRKRASSLAVIDIGSNSVRLVVFETMARSLVTVFNEKALCGLGREVQSTGLLSADAVAKALTALRRFRALCRIQQVGRIYAIATAACRDASNGPDFIARAERICGVPIEILSGPREAKLSALGVVSGIHNPDGIVGDLGGGSLELIDVKDGELRDGITLPLGPLRLIDMSGGSMKRARTIVGEYLDQAKILKKLQGRKFYAVGGTWRNLARLHMAQSKYPLHVLHYYTMTASQAAGVADLVSGLSSSSLREVRSISRSRYETLPGGALVLNELLQRGKAKSVVASVFGVREGLLYSKLPKRKMEADALLSSCWDFARRYARSPAHELELCDWTDQIFGEKGFKETAIERKLRYAACLLADIGWRAHPDYRAERSLGMISQAAFVGIDHPGRVFLALTVYYRYEGETLENDLASLIDESQMERAHLLSSLFRLAYILSAAMPGLLPRIGLKAGDNKSLILTMPEKLKDLIGERVEKRLASLALEMNRIPRIEIV